MNKNIFILGILMFLSVGFVSAEYSWSNVSRTGSAGDGVGISSDGSIIAVMSYYAGSHSELLMSYDEGLSWSNTFNCTEAWYVSMSSDGSKVFIPEYDGSMVHFSSDSGSSFSSIASPFGTSIWASTISGDGSTLIVVTEDSDYVWISRDAGVSWNSTFIDLTNVYFVSSNFDGSIIFLSSDVSGLYKSIDGGSSFSLIYAGTFYSVSASDDGLNICVSENPVVSDGLIISSDGGSSFSAMGIVLPSGGYGFAECSISNDGSSIVATSWTQGVFYSSDSGLTWNNYTSEFNYWYALAVSGDGSIIVAPEYSGFTHIGKIVAPIVPEPEVVVRGGSGGSVVGSSEVVVPQSVVSITGDVVVPVSESNVLSKIWFSIVDWFKGLFL